MAFKVSPVKRGLMVIHGIEGFIERFVERKLKEARIEEKVEELKRALKLGRRAPPPPPARAAPVPPPPPPARAEAVPAEPPPAGPKVPAPRRPAKAERPASQKPAKKAPAARKKAAPAARPVRAADPVTQLHQALEAHPQRAAILRAARSKDQLLRSLIPLYLAQGLDVDVTSGTVTKLWARHGIKFAAPNAAKALREHEGYSRRTSAGPLITPNGVKYVEDALAAGQEG